jgi:N-glycosylase/DNA lyase
VEYIRATDILKELWDTYGVAIDREYSLFSKSNERAIDEFFFVILGGFGISYELNKSGLTVLKNKDLINEKYFTSASNLVLIENRIRKEFSKKQFTPVTLNGQFRKYRYVETKPKVISEAGYWLWNNCSWRLFDKLSELDPLTARAWLCKCPGIGMKSASWLLRNTGFNDDCAVLDIHILRFLSYLGFNIPNQLTERIYLQLEEALRSICCKIGVSLGKMDYLLWILGRNGYLNYAR